MAMTHPRLPQTLPSSSRYKWTQIILDYLAQTILNLNTIGNKVVCFINAPSTSLNMHSFHHQYNEVARAHHILKNAQITHYDFFNSPFKLVTSTMKRKNGSFLITHPDFDIFCNSYKVAGSKFWVLFLCKKNLSSSRVNITLPRLNRKGQYTSLPMTPPIYMCADIYHLKLAEKLDTA